ncbi:peptidoglycan endopeptidase [Flavobacterium sp. N3904]|uniref:C40 family peptidase n=1 Tax=Flavobacterium sp. N3904 TaxID=2986835 RepID=UPI00222460E7|nr:peptidoglycan endopeptidase [Flavobacterium sp. N3904]
MKFFRIIVLTLIFCSVSVFSQDKNIKHTIVKGETISSIAQKYNVSAASIYKLNPKAKKTLQLNQVLLIPNSNSKSKETVSVSAKIIDINHEVLPKETLYGITKQYKTTAELLYKANPQLEAEGLKIGQTIVIPATGLTEKEISNVSQKTTAAENTVLTATHKVKPKESLYVIAKDYGITVKELKEINPQIGKKGLKAGQIIVIPANGKIASEALAVEEKPVRIDYKESDVSTDKDLSSVKNTKTNSPTENSNLSQKNSSNGLANATVLHQVKPKESLYVIAKNYGITLNELKKANPKIGKKGLSIGQTIVVPSNGKNATQAIAVEEKLTQSVSREGNIGGDKVLVRDDIASVNNDSIANSANETAVFHEVLPKETKYGIAKKYGITVAVLEKQNPEIEKKLLVGSKLTIKLPNSTLGMVKTEEIQESAGANSNITIANEDLINQLIESASVHIGTRYRSGGTTSSGFDCSGLMCSTFGSFDIKLPRSSIEQASFGERIDTEKVQKGDLIFFRTNGRSRINHVGMVVEVVDDEIKFIHSSIHSGVIISSTKEPYYRRYFAQVNRVLK